jgi:hypothetical protein
VDEDKGRFVAHFMRAHRLQVLLYGIGAMATLAVTKIAADSASKELASSQTEDS